jgi:hypothetical protein
MSPLLPQENKESLTKKSKVSSQFLFGSGHTVYFTFCRECLDSSVAESCAPYTGAIGAGTSVMPQK